MKKTISFVLATIVAVGVSGWGAFRAQAITIYTAEQVAAHNTASDCWLIISGQVYDVTNFIPIHPGGNAIVSYCGTDATAIFDSIHGSTGTAADLLPTYQIGTVGTPLTMPTNLAGTPTETTVALTWTASTGGISPVSYDVMRDGISAGTTSATTFSDTGLTASTTYSYVIDAMDGNTPADTTSSAALSVTTLASTGGGGSTSTPLTAPTNLAGVPTQTTVALTWTASTGGIAPVTYDVMRNGTSVGTTTSTSFTSAGLTPSTTYQYVIQATDSATPTADTTSSATLSVTTLASTGGGSTSTPLMAPSNVHGVPTETTVALTWTASTGGIVPITYVILKNGASIGTTTVTSFSATGLTASTTYTFAVEAMDSNTPPSSITSSEISVTTLGATVKGGGENENENETEVENENEGGHVHHPTSTPPTGGRGGDDGSGDWTIAGGGHGHGGNSSGSTGSSGGSTSGGHGTDD